MAEVIQIKIICAWCKKVIFDPGNTIEVSHGCCPDCSKILNSEIEEFRQDLTKKRNAYHEGEPLC